MIEINVYMVVVRLKIALRGRWWRVSREFEDRPSCGTYSMGGVGGEGIDHGGCKIGWGLLNKKPPLKSVDFVSSAWKQYANGNGMPNDHCMGCGEGSCRCLFFSMPLFVGDWTHRWLCSFLDGIVRFYSLSKPFIDEMERRAISALFAIKAVRT